MVIHGAKSILNKWSARKMSTISGKEKEAKGNPANAGYRTMVAKVAAAH
jgi:hypothetical protein